MQGAGAGVTSPVPAVDCADPIGFVGLGDHGLPIALNIIASGFSVLGYQRRYRPELSAGGGENAASIADIAERCSIIVTCLPSAAALTEVVSGAGGLASRIRPESILIDLSVMAIAEKGKQLSALRPLGAAMLDCAISGNSRYITERTAALFASGDRTAFDRCAPVLNAVTDHVTYVGDFGAGTTLKLIASMLVPAHTLAAAEALTLASRAGIDLQVVFDAIKGTQASSAMFESRGASMIRGDFSGPALSDYHQRNIQLAVEVARDLGGSYRQLEMINSCYQAAIDAGFGELDQSALFKFLSEK